MAQQLSVIRLPIKPTRLTRALAAELAELKASIITEYDICLLIRFIYQTKSKLNLRKSVPDKKDVRRIIQQLRDQKYLQDDNDYKNSFRISNNPEQSSDEIVCIADRFCHIAFFSAMERYRLTDRRPLALQISTPNREIWRALASDRMLSDIGRVVTREDEEIIPMLKVAHPKTVRGRQLECFETKNVGESIHEKGMFSRIATIGQTFLDMVSEPERCGGMHHVLDVWKTHAPIFIEEIITSIEKSESPIAKVQAGFILEEIVKITNPRMESWVNFAQRGGSRRLDPAKTL